MIADIRPEHITKFLAINKEFVHWLAPMDAAKLSWVLSIADYARQINNAAAVMIGYAHDADYPDHDNLIWFRQKFDNFFYIDRIIVDSHSQGQGLGAKLYADVEAFARARGHRHLCCEVNSVPDNPGSHKFHIASGFKPCGEQIFADKNKAVRYYAKAL